VTGAGERRREQLVVSGAGRGRRLDLFLSENLSGVSRKQVKRALDAGRVFVDGRVVRHAGLRLDGGETVRLTLDSPAPPSPKPELPVLYRDASLLAVNKPPGLPVHPSVDGVPNALDLVRELLESEEPPGTAVPVLLHRLDVDTSGVLLMALNAAANRDLAAQFAERRVVKDYLALVAGRPPWQLQIEDQLKPGVRGRTVRVQSGGRPACTRVRARALGPGFALVEAYPKTGRTHQIRAHLAAEGFPLLGDTLYGGPARIPLPDGGLLTAHRHLLHASRLAFHHPETARPVVIEAPMPEDFKPFLAILAVMEEGG